MIKLNLNSFSFKGIVLQTEVILFLYRESFHSNPGEGQTSPSKLLSCLGIDNNNKNYPIIKYFLPQTWEIFESEKIATLRTVLYHKISTN